MPPARTVRAAGGGAWLWQGKCLAVPFAGLTMVFVRAAKAGVWPPASVLLGRPEAEIDHRSASGETVVPA